MMENTVSESKKVWFILLSDAQSDSLSVKSFLRCPVDHATQGSSMKQWSAAEDAYRDC